MSAVRSPSRLAGPGSAASDPAPGAARIRRSAQLYSTPWFVRRQSLNAKRYLAGLAPIREQGLGRRAEAASTAHVRAANRLLHEARASLSQDVLRLDALARTIEEQGHLGPLRNDYFSLKDRIYARTREAEKLLAFYTSIFEQRRGRFGPRLLTIDRIARDCYQTVWMGLGRARRVPAPTPFAYIEDGNGPATYRRGVRMSALGRRPNPFPLVKLPQHRLHNPWTLGAVPHEVAHNLQNDLGMWAVLPKRIRSALRGHLPEQAITIWQRWHKENYADLAGTLLIGPAFVESLIDVVSKTPQRTAAFDPEGVHPTPIIRVPLNCVMLRRIGFEREAHAFAAVWEELYPRRLLRALPVPFRDSLEEGMARVVDATCFRPEPAYGGKALVEVIRFTQQDAAYTREAGERLIRSENTGVLPERFLIAAAWHALHSGKISPRNIARNFYRALGET